MGRLSSDQVPVVFAFISTEIDDFAVASFAHSRSRFAETKVDDHGTLFQRRGVAERKFGRDSVQRTFADRIDARQTIEVRSFVSGGLVTGSKF